MLGLFFVPTGNTCKVRYQNLEPGPEPETRKRNNVGMSPWTDNLGLPCTYILTITTYL